MHTAYCILHTAYDILHTAYCILQYTAILPVCPKATAVKLPRALRHLPLFFGSKTETFAMHTKWAYDAEKKKQPA